MNSLFVNIDTAKSRYAICKQCEEFYPFWKQCLKCGCIMPIKVTLSDSECPLKKWTKDNGDSNVNEYRYEE